MQKWEHRELTFTDMAIWRRFDVPDETSGISEGAAISPTWATRVGNSSPLSTASPA